MAVGLRTAQAATDLDAPGGEDKSHDLGGRSTAMPPGFVRPGVETGDGAATDSTLDQVASPGVERQVADRSHRRMNYFRRILIRWKRGGNNFGPTGVDRLS